VIDFREKQKDLQAGNEVIFGRATAKTENIRIGIMFPKSQIEKWEEKFILREKTVDLFAHGSPE
jgi:hypothetical protein